MIQAEKESDLPRNPLGSLARCERSVAVSLPTGRWRRFARHDNFLTNEMSGTRIPRRQINEKERIEENPHFLCENCYNIQFAFCDELKAYITGFVRSGNTYTANGAAEMIKEIVAHIKTDDLEILFRMDSGYFDDVIIEAIESAGCKYLIKGKEYPTLASQVTAQSISS